MSIRNLDHFLSKEDFGDAHDPLFDGTNTPPNVNTQASEIKAHSPESETNNTVTDTSDTQVPEPSEENPATASDPARDDETDAAVPPKTSAPLAHDTVEANEKAQTATTAAKTALEAFVPQARRAELIGFTKRQQADLGIAIKSIRRAAGIRGEFGISVESINEAIAVGNKHLARLAAEAGLLKAKVSTEARDDIELLQESGVSGADIAQFQRTQTEGVTIPAPLVQSGVVDPDDLLEPLAHPGATPLPMADALAVTEMELAHDSLMTELEVLQDGKAAIESYLELVRGAGKKGISKQAAAIMHTGLMNIDATCGLRQRTTGLEAFDTSPRSALETVSIEEGALMQRAREIGAKVLNWLIKIMEYVETYTLKYTGGISDIIKRFETLNENLAQGTRVLPAHEFKVMSKKLFILDTFVGDSISREETELPKLLTANRNDVMAKLFKPLLAILNRGEASPEMAQEISTLIEQVKANSTTAKYTLPGNAALEFKGTSVWYNENSREYNEHMNTQDQKNVTVEEMNLQTAQRNIQGILTYLESLSDTATAVSMLQSGSQLKSAILDLRARSKSVDESVFQAVQDKVMDVVTDVFHQRIYFGVLGDLAKAQSARLHYYTERSMGKAYQGDLH